MMILFLRTIIISDGRRSLSCFPSRINLTARIWRAIWRAIQNNRVDRLCSLFARADLDLAHLRVIYPTRVGTNAICADLRSSLYAKDPENGFPTRGSEDFVVA
jgi:hypothetical protein